MGCAAVGCWRGATKEHPPKCGCDGAATKPEASRRATHMSFLAPLFLFGALAVALPIVFHLIRRLAKEKLPFSSLMFLQPTPPRLTRRNRLENIFLLLLRCLVLCLVALGFARPFFQEPMLTEPANDTGKKIILLVDTSASMRRQNLWSAALAKAEDVLSKTSPADQLAVFTFDAQ